VLLTERRRGDWEGAVMSVGSIWNDMLHCTRWDCGSSYDCFEARRGEGAFSVRGFDSFHSLWLWFYIRLRPSHSHPSS
jgi:hypothetical protein